MSKHDPNKRYHTDEDLKRLAKDMVGNQIFCSDQIPKHERLTLVFPIVAMMDKGAHRQMKKHNVVHVYEYYNKALPRGVNGLPMFMSCHLLTKQDYLKLREYEDKIRKALESV